MNAKVFHLTQQGLDELKQELAELKEDKLPNLIERVRVAREQGDLSENSEYHAARDELSMAEGRVEELEELIGKAKIVTASNSSKVQLGSVVTVKTGKTEHTYHIVGKYEADPKNKKISDESPLGQALLGKKIGHDVEFEAPVGKIIYKVTEVK